MREVFRWSGNIYSLQDLPYLRHVDNDERRVYVVRRHVVHQAG